MKRKDCNTQSLSPAERLPSLGRSSRALQERAPDSAKKIKCTYRQYIYLQTVQKTMCKKTHTYTQYTQGTIKTYLVINTHCTHSTLCTHLYIVICEGATDYTLYNRLVVQRCNRLYICNVVDVHCMVSSDSRYVVLVQCVRVVQWNCVNVQCMACCVSGSVM